MIGNRDLTGNQSAMALADALMLLTERLGDLLEAKRVLVQRAQIGDLIAVATRAHGPFDGDNLDCRDWPIPADLWQRLGKHSDQEWRRGDLSAAPETGRYAELDEDYGKPLLLFGVSVEAVSLYRVLDSLPVEWIGAHEAIEMLLSMFGKGMGRQAGTAIAKRAHGGLVKTRARLFKWEAANDGAYRSRHKVEHEAHFPILPIGFWWANGDDALTQNWVSGDFSTWIDSTYHWQAFGVEFEKVGIEAMLPAQRYSSTSSSTDISVDIANRNPPAQPRARNLAHDHPYAAAKAAIELCGLDAAKRQTLNGPSVGKSMEPHYRLRHKSGQTPHEDNLDDYGKSVLLALTEHWSAASS